MTRTQVIQSLAYLQLMALPNDQRCNIMQKYIDTTSTPFTDWSVEAYSFDNGSTSGTAPEDGDIILATTSNSAPGPGGILQTMYFLAPV